MAARRKLIVVSNRGPVSFTRDDDGNRVARRGGGGLVTALRSLVAHHDVTWIASTMTDEDRTVAEEAGGEAIEEVARDGSSYRLRLVSHDPAAYDWFYNVIANPTLWFLQHYLWALAYAPDIDRGLHHAWDDGARYVLGFGVAELASHLRPRLQSVVLPILKRLSEHTNNTALLSVADGDQALILLSAEPPHSAMHLALREGARHPLNVGADGVAILAGRPPSSDDTPEVRLARQRGYAVSIGALQEGAVGVAAPIRVSDWTTASLGVVQLGVSVSGAGVPEAVMDAAAEAAALLSAARGYPAAIER